MPATEKKMYLPSNVYTLYKKTTDCNCFMTYLAETTNIIKSVIMII